MLSRRNAAHISSGHNASEMSRGRAGASDRGGARGRDGRRGRRAHIRRLRPCRRSAAASQHRRARDRRPDAGRDGGAAERAPADRRRGRHVRQQLRFLLALLPVARDVPHRAVLAQQRRARKRAAARVATRSSTGRTRCRSGCSRAATTPCIWASTSTGTAAGTRSRFRRAGASGAAPSTRRPIATTTTR